MLDWQDRGGDGVRYGGHHRRCSLLCQRYGGEGDGVDVDVGGVGLPSVKRGHSYLVTSVGIVVLEGEVSLWGGSSPW